jgi:hypothetical protein
MEWIGFVGCECNFLLVAIIVGAFDRKSTNYFFFYNKRNRKEPTVETIDMGFTTPVSRDLYRLAMQEICKLL